MSSPPAPALDGIVGRDGAFPRDQNAHHRAPNEFRLLDPPERISDEMSRETELASAEVVVARPARIAS